MGMYAHHLLRRYKVRLIASTRLAILCAACSPSPVIDLARHLLFALGVGWRAARTAFVRGPRNHKQYEVEAKGQEQFNPKRQDEGATRRVWKGGDGLSMFGFGAYEPLFGADGSRHILAPKGLTPSSRHIRGAIEPGDVHGSFAHRYRGVRHPGLTPLVREPGRVGDGESHDPARSAEADAAERGRDQPVRLSETLASNIILYERAKGGLQEFGGGGDGSERETHYAPNGRYPAPRVSDYQAGARDVNGAENTSRINGAADYVNKLLTADGGFGYGLHARGSNRARLYKVAGRGVASVPAKAPRKPTFSQASINADLTEYDVRAVEAALYASALVVAFIVVFSLS